MMIVMPMAMMPMGADCLNSSSMLSASMKALSLTARNSPAIEKKISSRTMKPQMAPLLRYFERVPACIVFPPLRNRRPKLAALGCNIEPDSKNDDDPGHNELNVELQTNQKQPVLDKAQDQNADHGFEDRPRAPQKRRTAKNDRCQNLKFQTLPNSVLRPQRPAGLNKPRHSHAKGADQVAHEHRARTPDTRECRRCPVAPDGINLTPEGCLGQHRPQEHGHKCKQQDRNGDSKRVTLSKDRKPCAFLVVDIHILAARIGQRQTMNGR